jgi:hypothetical protein
MNDVVINGMRVSRESLALVRDSLIKAGISEDLLKATFNVGTITSGLTFYDLEPLAKLVYPVLTPLRNYVPRVPGEGGTATNWRSITAIDTTQVPLGVAAGVRGGVIGITTQDNTAPYVTLGQEANQPFEAEMVARGFDDTRALQAKLLLESVMIGEEKLLIGGNGSVALGTTPTVAATGAITGGTLAAATFHVRCVALTFAAYQLASLALGIPTTIAVVSADGGTTTNVNGGAAQVSADATGVVASGTTGSIAVTVAAVPGAVAYAWFMSAGGGAAGSEVLNQITTSNAATLVATRTTVTPGAGFADTIGTAFNADRSVNNLVFDGLISIIAKSGSGAYVASLDNAQLNTDSAGGVIEINTALRAFWDTKRLSPDCIWVNAQQQQDITSKVIAGGGAPLFRFIGDMKAGASEQGSAIGGSLVRSYLNKFALDGAKEIPIRLHPNVPAGTILFTSSRLPYPVSNVGNVLQVKAQEEYRQWEWPIRTRQYETGVYVRETLQCYFPPAFGMINNVRAG